MSVLIKLLLYRYDNIQVENNNGAIIRGRNVVNQRDSDDEQSGSDSHGNTRRQFVAGSAGALGTLAVGSALSGSALAQDEDEEDSTDDDTESEETSGEFEDDVAILNYALTLEYLEARFYRQGLDNIGEDGLCSCAAFSEDSDLADRVYDELRTIQQHEEEHVETLVSTIESLDGTPIEEPEFDFGLAVQYPIAFLATAAQLEDIGVSAYAGAAPSIQNGDLVEPALGIHSTEAPHASFLWTLNGQTGFPSVIDEPRSRSEVLELASAFIVDGGGGGDSDDDSTEAETDNEAATETGDDDMNASTGNETATASGDGTEAVTSTDDGTATSTGNGNETTDS